MADFPITKAPSEKYFSFTTFKKQVRSQFENGIGISRSQHTRARKKLTIGWDALPKTEYMKLVAFFETNTGTYFNYTDPFSGEVKMYRFTSDEMPKSRQAGWVFNSDPDVNAQEIAVDTGAIEIEEF